MATFAEAIKAAQNGAADRGRAADTGALASGPEVQLSVRMPEGLRSAVAATAAAQQVTVTRFVHQALHRAVLEANDSFAGLAADLARHLRAEIRSAVEDGAYGEMAAMVEREEAWS